MLLMLLYFNSCRIDDTLNCCRIDDTLRNFNSALEDYFNIVFVAPNHFVCTSHYKELTEFTVESLFECTDVVPLQINGPKGVGKSTSLFALAIKLTAANKAKAAANEAKGSTVLYFTESSISETCGITKAYLDANKVTCSVDRIAGHLVQSKDRKFVVCADIGKCNDPEGNKLLALLRPLLGNHRNIRLIIAHSSGEGVDERNKAFYKKLNMFGSKMLTLTNFSEEEAKYFIDMNELNEINFDHLKRITNFNPLLLSKVKRAKTQRWKDKFDTVFQQHLHASIQREIEDHTISTFHVADKKLRTDFLGRLSQTDYFLYHAKNGIPLKFKELCQFELSWVCQDGHCYVSEYDEENQQFMIALNFPNSDQIISKKIEALVECMNMEEALSASQLGCHFELELYRAFSRTGNLVIAFGEPEESLMLKINFCCDDPFSTLLVGCLNKLYHQHPAIDFVGLLRDENEKLYLLMMQVSISSYADHQAKLFHLNKTYNRYDEFKTTKVLDYYKNMCSEIHQVIYVYVSPKEHYIPTSLRKHQSDHKLDLKLGRIYENCENRISRTLSKFRLKHDHQ